MAPSSAVLTVQREVLSPALVAELSPLLESHFHEIAHYLDIPLNVEWAAYEAAEANDVLRVYTMRDQESDNALIGYAAFFVRPSPHYRDSLQAASDVVFVAPLYRGARNGDAFLAFCDEQLKAEGVQVVYHHLKFAHDWSKLLLARGYEPMDAIYAKRLDREDPS